MKQQKSSLGHFKSWLDCQQRFPSNLVLIDNNSKPLRQSFSYPTDTLLSNQLFFNGMRLVSEPNSNNLSSYLEMKTGDVILYGGFTTPQPYWTLANDFRKTINQEDGVITSASLISNSWSFFNHNQTLVWQFLFSDDSRPDVTRAAVLGEDGFISFYNLQDGIEAGTIKIPEDECSTPEPWSPFFICEKGKMCHCLAGLASCNPWIDSPCNSSKSSMTLVRVGDEIDYFALGFVEPFPNFDLNGCMDACLTTAMLLFAVGLLCLGVRYHQKNKRALGSFKDVLGEDDFSSQDALEENNFLDSLFDMPIHFYYKDLQTATNNFSVKLGQGGFGSVYKGMLPDGTQIAVKKLEGVGQGKKEFQAEITTIGGIHHVHLVSLKGFCMEGPHRLLAYEYMAFGSLDKWIFRKNREGLILDWETRFNIVLGIAKGLAYLHGGCDVKIVHCDIKPENVLLDENYKAKISDFGLAKLMTREQSRVVTMLRGTRGYLAPEWVTEKSISEKSDVYSFGMVLLEIIGGRRNFNPAESSEKAYLPTYALKMMEEGKLKEILDSKLKIDEGNERVLTAAKVALWCIQGDMSLRPSMDKVVQMLEGLCAVPQPPSSSQMGSHFFSNFVRPIREECTSPRPPYCHSDANLSSVELSGPR
ncbi:hypothetical protein F0562_030109 [Nyssa sinensis]|uniref:non-specific serine/threonine protein kinase n=1 Tax=Nyssa sinensis TaxID=561372 RepID=A0A5J5AZ41_9ASTE|nr:hypothetical protein F0562_030109 [Nyssa sinensis]